MKSASLGIVMLSATVIVGCGSGSSAPTVNPPKGHEQRAKVEALPPEAAIAKIETSEDRVIYLHQLANDSTFEPQKHTEMLQKYAADKDKDVAAAAKELLDRK